MKKYTEKIVTWDELKKEVDRHRGGGKKIVFTNGCFDMLHSGHAHLLNKISELGDVMVMAINSDESIRKIKGPERPIHSERDRAELLAALQFVDYVTIFGQDTPHEILALIKPDVLAKGSDWGEEIHGREVVEEYGGEIVSIPVRKGRSTTNVIKQIKQMS